MEQIIYADILFLIDLSMDYLALYITASALKMRFYAGSAIISATIGAAFSVLSVIMRKESLLLLILISILMCFITFRSCGFGSKIKALALFYGVNMLLGGAMTAAFNLFNRITENEKLLVLYGQVNTVRGGMPITVFYAGFVLIVIAFKLISKILSRRSTSNPIKLTVKLDGKSADFTACEDSGNKVCEPISGEPVIFLKESAMKKIASESTVSAMKMGSEIYNVKRKQKLRIVIYQTLSGSEMCACIKPDMIRLGKKDCSAWIAIGKQIHMSEIDGIVPSSLLG